MGTVGAMSEVTILHNPRCSKSRAALAEVPDAQVVEYLREPLSRSALVTLLEQLEDPPQALVRRDGVWKELGLTTADIARADQVVDLLAAHPSLMERPVVLSRGRAIIGRPTERVAAFLG